MDKKINKMKYLKQLSTYLGKNLASFLGGGEGKMLDIFISYLNRIF